jgi:hypothetical protein
LDLLISIKTIRINGNNLNNYKMGSSTTDNGRIVSDAEMENKFGKMDPFIREIGKTIWPMEKEDLSIQVAMSIKEIGLMIKLKEKEFIYTLTARVIQGNGIKTNNMDLVNKNGLMEQNMKEIL